MILTPIERKKESPIPSFVHKPLSAFPAFRVVEEKWQKAQKALPKKPAFDGFQTNITVPTSSSYTDMSLLRMFGALIDNQPVEIQIHRKSTSSQKANPTKFASMMADQIHLRPDVILASMPTGTAMLINPQTDFSTKACWVIEPGNNGVGRSVNRTGAFIKARRLAEQEQKWIDFEKAEGRYREWNSWNIMTEKRRAKTIRMEGINEGEQHGNRAEDQNTTHTDRFPEKLLGCAAEKHKTYGL